MEIKELLKKKQTAMQKEMIGIIESEAEGEILDYLESVINQGCKNGACSALIYYDDTTKFFETHKNEMSAAISDTLCNTGMKLEELAGFDKDDILCVEVNNQNLLVWLVFEEFCYNLLNEYEEVK